MNPAPETIAICDDDAALRRMLSDHLSELGYEILQAANAKELKAWQPRQTPHWEIAVSTAAESFVTNSSISLSEMMKGGAIRT